MRRAASMAAVALVLATWPTTTQDLDPSTMAVPGVDAHRHDAAPLVEQQAPTDVAPAPAAASLPTASRLLGIAAAEADRDRALELAASAPVAATTTATSVTPTTSAPTSPAPAKAAPAAPAEPRHERIGREALSRLRYIDAAALGWAIEFHPGRDGFLGIADWERRTVDVWIRDSHDVQDVLGTIAHELAHVYDYEHWTPEVRDTWLELRGLDIEWWPSCTCDDRGFGAGDIAEAMVILEAGAGEWTGRFGQPTRTQLDWLTAQL